MLRNEYLLDYMNLMNYVTNGVKTDLVFFIFLPGESKYEQQRYMYTHSIKKNENNSSPEINSHNTHRRHFLKAFIKCSSNTREDKIYLSFLCRLT